MSRDFQLAWECPHLTVEEVVTLAEDRMTLPTRQPVAGSGTVRILLNDEWFVPNTGLFSAAQLFSSQAGPFDLVEGEDTFTVETSTGVQSVTFGVRNKQRFTTAQIIQKMLSSGFSVATLENINEHLALTDSAKVGLSSFVKVSGGAAFSLGFGSPGKSAAQRGAQGHKLYPGWQLLGREDEMLNRYPKFTEPLRGDPIIKVTYTVPKQRCRRCRSSEVENDLRFASDGNAILVDEEDLLYQAALKILLTDRGSNPYHTWYGTTIRSRIGTKALGGVAALLSDDVRKAMSSLQAMQKEQGKYQAVSPKERLYNVLNVHVNPHAQDPTTFLIDVTVQNASSEAINLKIVYTAPGVVALMGSNGLLLPNAAGVR